MSMLSRMSMVAVLATASACAVDAADDPVASATAQASTPVQNINTAETSFRAAVVQNVTASASVAGITFATTGIVTGYNPNGRTVAAGATTRRSQAIFVSRSVPRSSGGSYSPGMYELVETSTGAVARYHDPALGIVVVPPPPPGPVELHTPLGDEMCGDAPSGVNDFCQRFVACYAYDLFC